MAPRPRSLALPAGTRPGSGVSGPVDTPGKPVGCGAGSPAGARRTGVVQQGPQAQEAGGGCAPAPSPLGAMLLRCMHHLSLPDLAPIPPAGLTGRSVLRTPGVPFQNWQDWLHCDNSIC